AVKVAVEKGGLGRFSKDGRAPFLGPQLGAGGNSACGRGSAGRHRGVEGAARLATGGRGCAERRSEFRAQDELALETARLKTAVCLGDLIERDPFGDARSDSASCQHAKEPLQVLPEPGGMQPPP